MTYRIGAAVLAGLAALVLTPSCGSDPDTEREMQMRRYMRAQVTGTWSLSVEGSGAEIVLRLEPEQNDALIPTMSGCTGSRLSFVAPAHACIPTWDIPVEGSSSSDEARYAGVLSGTAMTHSATGPVGVWMAFATGGLRLEAEVENEALTGELRDDYGFVARVTGERVP